MKNFCGVCGHEKRYAEVHRMYRRCDLCYNKHALKFYYNEKDYFLEKKKNYYHNDDEFFSEQNMKQKSKTPDLESRSNTLIKMLKTTISVSKLCHIHYYLSSYTKYTFNYMSDSYN